MKIAILGSTGSIGKITVNIVKNDKKNFEVILLTANNNYKELLKQVKELKPKNIIINNKLHFIYLKKKFKNKKINIFNNFKTFKKKFNNKVDYTMSAISGLEGLIPTLESISFSKKIAIANKESIICAWNLIENLLKKNKCKFLPIDSEHFSINELLNSSSNEQIAEIIITASGGPFLNLPLSKFKKINPKMAIKHPKWKMGKKISVDSSTLMNKIFELIEAKKIFNLELKKLKILIHPSSYVHAIVKFNNGLSKILVHDTNMKIPIFNSLYPKKGKSLATKKLNIKKLNNLNFTNVDKRKFPLINLIKKIPKKNTLFETVIVSANDELVKLFLEKKISFLEISKILNKITNLKEFLYYKKVYPKNLRQIVDLNETVRLKTRILSII